MTHIRWEQAAIDIAVGRWEELETLMGESSKEFTAASSGGLASSVQGAAKSFLSAWSGYAGESQAIAEGFVKALGDTGSDMTGVDGAQAGDYKNLDGRLGPAR